MRWRVPSGSDQPTTTNSSRFRHLILSQERRSDSYRPSTRFETIPSRPCSQASLWKAGLQERTGDGWVLVGPVVAASRNDFHRALFDPRVHAVAVEFDLVQPAVAVRGRFHERGKLGLDPRRNGLPGHLSSSPRDTAATCLNSF